MLKVIGLEIYKHGRNGKTERLIKFFPTKQARDEYVRQYVYTRPAVAAKTILINRLDGEVQVS